MDILLIIYKQEKNKTKKDQVEKKMIDSYKRNLLIIFMKNISDSHLEINIVPQIVKYYLDTQQFKKHENNVFYKILTFLGDAENFISIHKKQPED